MRKKILFLGILGICAGLLYYVAFFIYGQQKTKKLSVEIYVNNTQLSQATIIPDSISVDTGQIVSLKTSGLFIKEESLMGGIWGPKLIPISPVEIIKFSIPGKSGEFRLGAFDWPTEFQCPQAGELKFGVEYKKLADYIKAIRFASFTGRNKKGPVVVKVHFLGKFSKQRMEPRKIISSIDKLVKKFARYNLVNASIQQAKNQSRQYWQDKVGTSGIEPLRAKVKEQEIAGDVTGKIKGVYNYLFNRPVREIKPKEEEK